MTWGDILVLENPSWKGAAKQRPGSVSPSRRTSSLGVSRGHDLSNILAQWTLTLRRGYSLAKAGTFSREKVLS